MSQDVRRPTKPIQPALAALAAFALAACTQTASAPTPPSGAVPGLTPNTFSLPSGTGCAGEIARFKAVLKNDVDTGNVGQSVYNRASADLARGDASCAAGRDGEALSVLAATKSRFGYR